MDVNYERKKIELIIAGYKPGGFNRIDDEVVKENFATCEVCGCRVIYEPWINTEEKIYRAFAVCEYCNRYQEF